MIKIGQSAHVCFVKAEQKTFVTFWNSEYFFLLYLLFEVIKESSVLFPSDIDGGLLVQHNGF